MRPVGAGPAEPVPPARRRRPVASALALAGLAVLFVVLTALVWRTGAEVGLDRTLSRLTTTGPATRLVTGDQLAGRLEEAVDLGSAPIVVALSAILAVAALAWGDPRGAVLALAGPGLTGALTQYVLKPLVTPAGMGGDRAFPSGHAGGAASVALVAVVLVHRRWGRVPALLLAGVAPLPVLAVGHALVRLGYHYPTDVVGGLLLAAVAVLGPASILARPGPPARRAAPQARGAPELDPAVLQPPQA